MSKTKIIITILCLAAVVAIYKNYSKTDTIEPKVPVAATKPSVTVIKIAVSQGLNEAINKTLSEAAGTYAVAVKNLKTGESFYLNERQVFETASLYKNWVMAETFDQVSQGIVSEDQVLSQSVFVLNDKFNIDEEEAELTKGVVTMKVKDALEKMITVSDNYAALLLSEKIRLSSVESYLKEKGFKESSLGVPPKTTAYDTAQFFEKLYKGELANPVYTKKMLDLLKRQQRNGGIPKYLSENIEVAHKTGELGSVKHDAGIVFTGMGDYVIVVLTETSSQAAAEAKIADISKAVYEYFQNKTI